MTSLEAHAYSVHMDSPAGSRYARYAQVSACSVLLWKSYASFRGVGLFFLKHILLPALLIAILFLCTFIPTSKYLPIIDGIPIDGTPISTSFGRQLCFDHEGNRLFDYCFGVLPTNYTVWTQYQTELVDKVAGGDPTLVYVFKSDQELNETYVYCQYESDCITQEQLPFVIEFVEEKWTVYRKNEHGAIVTNSPTVNSAIAVDGEPGRQPIMDALYAILYRDHTIPEGQTAIGAPDIESMTPHLLPYLMERVYPADNLVIHNPIMYLSFLFGIIAIFPFNRATSLFLEHMRSSNLCLGPLSTAITKYQVVVFFFFMAATLISAVVDHKALGSPYKPELYGPDISVWILLGVPVASFLAILACYNIHTGFAIFMMAAGYFILLIVAYAFRGKPNSVLSGIMCVLFPYTSIPYALDTLPSLKQLLLTVSAQTETPLDESFRFSLPFLFSERMNELLSAAENIAMGTVIRWCLQARGAIVGSIVGIALHLTVIIVCLNDGKKGTVYSTQFAAGTQSILGNPSNSVEPVISYNIEKDSELPQDQLEENGTKLNIYPSIIGCVGTQYMKFSVILSPLVKYAFPSITASISGENAYRSALAHADIVEVVTSAPFPNLPCRTICIAIAAMRGIQGGMMQWGQEAERCLSAVGLWQEGVASLPTSKLNEDQRRRLWVATALCGRPRIIILELTNDVLSPKSCAILETALREAATDSVVFLCADVPSKLPVPVDKLVFDYFRKIVQCDSPAKILAAHCPYIMLHLTYGAGTENDTREHVLMIENHIKEMGVEASISMYIGPSAYICLGTADSAPEQVEEICRWLDGLEPSPGVQLLNFSLELPDIDSLCSIISKQAKSPAKELGGWQTNDPSRLLRLNYDIPITLCGERNQPAQRKKMRLIRPLLTTEVHNRPEHKEKKWGRAYYFMILAACMIILLGVRGGIGNEHVYTNASSVDYLQFAKSTFKSNLYCLDNESTWDDVQTPIRSVMQKMGIDNTDCSSLSDLTGETSPLQRARDSSTMLVQFHYNGQLSMDIYVPPQILLDSPKNLLSINSVGMAFNAYYYQINAGTRYDNVMRNSSALFLHATTKMGYTEVKPVIRIAYAYGFALVFMGLIMASIPLLLPRDLPLVMESIRKSGLMLTLQLCDSAGAFSWACVLKEFRSTILTTVCCIVPVELIFIFTNQEPGSAAFLGIMVAVSLYVICQEVGTYSVILQLPLVRNRSPRFWPALATISFIAAVAVTVAFMIKGSSYSTIMLGLGIVGCLPCMALLPFMFAIGASMFINVDIDYMMTLIPLAAHIIYVLFEFIIVTRYYPKEKPQSAKANAWDQLLAPVGQQDSCADIALAVDGVSHTYQDQDRWSPALSNTTFNVNHHECVGVIGCNGSGKTTLCKIAAGDFQPTTGSVTRCGGRVAFASKGSFFSQTRPVQSARLIGYLSGCPYDWYSRIIDLLQLDEGISWMSPSARYRESLARCTELACAINTGADTLIIDDILSSVDDRWRVIMLNMLESLMKAGVAIMLTSTGCQDVGYLATNVVSLTCGRPSMNMSREEFMRRNCCGPVVSLLIEYGDQKMAREWLAKYTGTWTDRVVPLGIHDSKTTFLINGDGDPHSLFIRLLSLFNPEKRPEWIRGVELLPCSPRTMGLYVANYGLDS